MAMEASAAAGKGRIGFAGDILWLGVTAFVLALIMGILCWPLSAELSPRLLAGTSSDKPAPEPGAPTAAGAPAGVLSVNRLPLPGASRTTTESIGERSSSTVLTTSIGAVTEVGEIKLSLLDPNADRLPGERLPDRKKLTQAQPGAQPSQSASASSPAPQPGPRRPQRRRQPARTVAPGPELVPW